MVRGDTGDVSFSRCLPGRLAADLALQISNETAPPGGWAQIKVSALTPQLVSTRLEIALLQSAIYANIKFIFALLSITYKIYPPYTPKPMC